MSEVYFEVRVTEKGGTEIHSCGTLEEIYDIVAGAVIGSTQAVQKQLGRGDEFSAAGVNMFMSKLMHYAQRDMTNTRCSIVLPMGFKKGGDERGRYEGNGVRLHLRVCCAVRLRPSDLYAEHRQALCPRQFERNRDIESESDVERPCRNARLRRPKNRRTRLASAGGRNQRGTDAA